MRVHVFRPQADADRTARTVREQGFEPVVTPLFTIVPLSEPAPEGPFDALVLSSGNAIAPLAAAPANWRELPVFAVGARTAARAREAGFTDSRSADGNRDDMIALVTGNVPKGAKLLLVSGRERSEDVAPRLEEAGFAVTVWTAYAAEAVETLPEELAAALKSGGEAAALHYSPRGAKIFLALTKDAGLGAEALALTHVALSAAVAAPLISAGADTVLVAEHPEEPALLAALAEVSARSTGTPTDAPEAAPVAAPVEPPSDTPARAEDSEAQARPAFAPVPVSPPPQPALLPRLLVASLLGGVVGAGLMMLALGRNAAPAVTPEQIAELGGRLDALQKSTAVLPDRAAYQALEQKAAATADAARAATNRLAELAAAKPAGPDPALLAGLSEEAKRAQNEAGAAQAAATALSQRLASVESAAKANAAPSRQAMAAARLALTERLQSALGSGRPFSADLAALAAGGVPAEQLAPLRALAETGAPRPQALLSQFRGHAALFVRETTPRAGGWQDQLLGLASRVVTIRPAGDAHADDPTMLPTQIEAALTRGEIATAARAWSRLPEPARRESAAFGAALQRVTAAEAALAQIAQEAVTAMGTPG